MSSPLLEYNKVTVYRGDRVVLDGFNLTIGADEHVAIVGPNGSGKSTIIKTITRECYPMPVDGAHLRIMGQEIWNVFDLRVLLGIVSNDLLARCTRDFTGYEIVLSGFFSSVGLWPYHHVTPEMDRKGAEVMEAMEITHLKDRWMDELSSGEARRFLLARALVHDPKALILDEPSNSLDPHAFLEFRRIMRKLAQTGTSIILVTHHLPDIIPEIGRVVMIRDGRVFADGPKEQVLQSKELSGLFNTPLNVQQRDGYYQLA